jgi:hypothetical protein
MLKRIKIMFNVNDKITSSDDTEANALDVFKKAVGNGQTRLALEALVDVVDSIIDFITSEPEDETAEEAVVAPDLKTATIAEVKEEKVEPTTVEATASAKKKAKETTTSISE